MQMLRMPQYITGPVVNMMLIMAALIVSQWSGIFIGAVTPYIAFIAGILPAPLAPIIPFIMAGNAAYVLLFSLLKHINQYLGILVASLVKFAILALAVHFLIDVPPPIAQMMQFPQLITALTGGYLALFIVRELRKRDLV